MWKARNCWTFNAKMMIEMDIVQQAWEEWMEFKVQQQKQELEKTVKECWEPAKESGNFQNLVL